MPLSNLSDLIQLLLPFAKMHFTIPSNFSSIMTDYVNIVNTVNSYNPYAIGVARALIHDIRRRIADARRENARRAEAIATHTQTLSGLGLPNNTELRTLLDMLANQYGATPNTVTASESNVNDPYNLTCYEITKLVPDHEPSQTPGQNLFPPIKIIDNKHSFPCKMAISIQRHFFDTSNIPNYRARYEVECQSGDILMSPGPQEYLSPGDKDSIDSASSTTLTRNHLFNLWSTTTPPTPTNYNIENGSPGTNFIKFSGPTPPPLYPPNSLQIARTTANSPYTISQTFLPNNEKPTMLCAMVSLRTSTNITSGTVTLSITQGQTQLLNLSIPLSSIPHASWKNFFAFFTTTKTKEIHKLSLSWSNTTTTNVSLFVDHLCVCRVKYVNCIPFAFFDPPTPLPPQLIKTLTITNNHNGVFLTFLRDAFFYPFPHGSDIPNP